MAIRRFAPNGPGAVLALFLVAGGVAGVVAALLTGPSVSALLPVLAMAAIPVVLLLALPGRKLPLVPRRLLRAFAAYYGVAYVARGLYLLIVSPAPGYNVLIADARLLRPTYLQGLEALAPVALVGLVVLLSSFYWGSRALGRWARVLERPVAPVWATSLAVTLAAGWVFRLGLMAAHNLQPTGPSGRLSYVATAALALLILRTDWRGSLWLRLVVTFGVLGEVFWGVEVSSKDFVLAAALFLYLDPQRRRISVQAVLAVSAAILVAFAIIQPAKNTVAYGTSTVASVPVSILARFDLLHAFTDAETDGAGSYMSTSTFVSTLFGDWMPQSVVGSNRVASGVLWGEVMDGDTSGVSLADGPTAEGYAMYGLLGVIVWNALVGLIGAAIAYIASRSLSYPVCLAAVSVVASNAIFERGLLGLNEAFSTAAQIALLALIPYVVVTWAMSRDRTTQSVALPHPRGPMRAPVS